MRNKLLALFVITLGLISLAYAKPILNIQKWQTKKGINVYFVRAPQIPMVDVLVAFNAGSDRDGKQLGLANLTASMLGEATQNLNANEIADDIDSLGMVFDVKVNKDMTVVHLRSLTAKKYLKPSLALFTKLLTEAEFPKTPFDRVQNNTLQAIAQQQQNPRQVASKVFSSLVFSGSAYAHPTIGTLASIKSLEPMDLAKFYRQYYGAKNAIIVIVGDVENQQAKIIAKTLSTALPEGKAAASLNLVKNNNAKTVHVNFPSDQTSIRIGEVGIPYKDTTNHALIVSNYILGSGMTSRLFKIVREKYGLTYGIGSYFVPLANRGAFIIGLQTKTSQVKQAVDLTKKIVDQYLKTGPTKLELQAAKNYLIGSFPLKIESNADIANYVLTSAFFHLPFNYLDTYTKDIHAVTAAQAKAAIDKYVNPKNFITVTVGRTSAINPSNQHAQAKN